MGYITECSGKFKFPDFAAARKSIRKGNKATPYRCRFCQEIHIGTPRRSKNERQTVDKFWKNMNKKIF